MAFPLSDPPTPVAPTSIVEQVCIFVPILGWIVAALLERQRRMPKARHIENELAARIWPTTATWGDDPERARIAAAVSEAIQQEFGWPNAHYVPQDKLELLMWGVGGGNGGEVLICLIDIERRLGVKLLRSTKELWKLTLGELVDYIMTKAPGSGAATRPRLS